MGLHRTVGRPAFTERQRLMAQVVLDEVGWLHRLSLPDDLGESVPRLAPRLRAVLGLLLQGRSKRQVAAHLGITEHTAHGYTKQIFGYFGVQGRGQLIGRFMGSHLRPIDDRAPPVR